MNYKFRLSKVHCAGCALALQEKLNSIDGVEASINFVTKSLFLEISTSCPAETLTEVKMQIHKFDHAIELLPFEEDEHEIRRKRSEKIWNAFRFSASAIALILNFFLVTKWLKISLYAISYILLSYEIIYNSIVNISHGKIFDENFLMTIASIGAFAIGEYAEAVMVMLLYDIGQLLENYAVAKSQRTIKSVLEIKQPYANLVVGESELKVELNRVKVGSIIRIKPGEKVPLDSKIIEGTSYINMSALTGETKDMIASPGDELLSGSINGSSVLLASVTKLEEDSTISKIVELVKNASESKAKSEKFISKFCKYYTPIVIVLAFAIMLFPPLFFGLSSFKIFAYRALCFLVVSCPCALVISVPLGYFAGIGSSAKSGIFVKGASLLEELSKVDSVIFDKTGTLTKGDFEISEIYATEGHSKDEVLELCAYAESYSNHRIAKSIERAYDEKFDGKQINSAWINGYEELAGLGIKANIFMQDVLVGNAKLLKNNDVNFVEVSKPGTVLYVAVAQEFAGYIVISDTIKKDAVLAIEKLKALGIEDIGLCTGDEENVARAVAGAVQIKSYYSKLLPEDKLNILQEKMKNKKTVAFVGDGINDAPSLASASVGISMGGFGSDVAVESSDVVLMTDEPSKVAEAIKKAKRTKKIVLENIIGSISIKVAILLLISLGFAGMSLAVFADVGVSLIAVLNSLRALLK